MRKYIYQMKAEGVPFVVWKGDGIPNFGDIYRTMICLCRAGWHGDKVICRKGKEIVESYSLEQVCRVSRVALGGASK